MGWGSLRVGAPIFIKKSKMSTTRPPREDVRDNATLLYYRTMVCGASPPWMISRSRTQKEIWSIGHSKVSEPDEQVRMHSPSRSLASRSYWRYMLLHLYEQPQEALRHRPI